ncbi:MAG TPA: radical SAM protein, partial [Candidatus Sulfotelmatobacter sp.]|nr:radical SAM protein [Candidatus Sulfotelmatobacter sp.]
IAPYGAAVYLGGAEPLLRRDFFDIVAHIKHRGLRASFTTNGTLLTARKIEKLVAMQVDHVTFSVDGDETLHDRIRGTGSYKRVVWSIQTLCQRRNAAGATRPGISVNIAVTGPLVSRLTSALAAIRDATGDLPDIYRIHHLWYVTPEELTAHQSATRRLLGCGAPGAASHVIPRSQVDEATLLAAELRVARAWPKVTCFPDLSDEEVVAYYTDPDGDRPRCVAPFFQVLVKPNGDVLFCPDGWIDDFVLGNVRQESFEDIWNGERARKFRQVLFAEKSFPACRRCSFMYSGRGR